MEGLVVWRTVEGWVCIGTKLDSRREEKRNRKEIGKKQTMRSSRTSQSPASVDHSQLLLQDYVVKGCRKLRFYVVYSLDSFM